MTSWLVHMGPHRPVIDAPDREAADRLLDQLCADLDLERQDATFLELDDSGRVVRRP